METTLETDVLVVGGGIVGLTAALFLQYHGVASWLVERRSEPSPLPRSRGVHGRSVELFRQLGLETEVQEAARRAVAMGRFGGARRGSTLVASEPLSFPRDRIGDLVAQEPSPSEFCFCPQPLLEPVLRGALESRGADVRFGVEARWNKQDASGATLVRRDVATDEERRVRARYVVAADGANSPLRRQLGFQVTEVPPDRHYLNHYFPADLRSVVEGRTFSQCEITGGRVRGLFLSKNNTDEWSFHLEYDPAAESPGDYSAHRSVAAIREALGLPDLGVELLSVGSWDTGTTVADTYRAGRLFLAGDAAHRHAPWGGFGANTGIADAQNLAWKLSAVLRGRAGDRLLDTYTAERRPAAWLAALQSRLRSDFDARYGILTKENQKEVAQLVDLTSVMLRQRYASPAIASQLPWGIVEHLRGEPGTRVPHAWLQRDGRQLSTLDLVGPAWTLFQGPDAPPWDTYVATPDAVQVVRLQPGEAVEGLAARGRLLVRPDQVVADRPETELPPEALVSRWRQLLGA